MANKPISITIKGDYTDKDIKRAIRDLGSLQTQAPKTTRAMTGLNSSFKALGATLVAGIGFAAVTRGIQTTISAASSLEEAQSKVNVVFGDSAMVIEQWADTASTAMVMSKASALEAVGTFGNLFQAFGIGQNAARDMSTTLVELAADLASFNNTSTEDAILALRSGLSGETEPLKRYGVALTDARLKTEAFNLGIYEGKGILDANQKSQAAFNLIMKDTALAQGDVERTADNYANQMRALGAAVDDASAIIGKEFIRAITGATEAMGGTKGLVGTIEDAGDGLADFVAGIGLASKAMLEFQGGTSDTALSIADIAEFGYKATPGLGLFIQMTDKLAGAGNEVRTAEEQLNDEIQRSILMRHTYKASIDNVAVAEARAGSEAEDAKAKVDALNNSMSRFAAFGDRQSGRINLRRMRAEGIDPGSDKKVSKDEAKEFAIGYAGQVRDVAQSLIEDGRLKDARRVLTQGREYLTGAISPTLGDNAGAYVRKLGLTTSPELRDGIAANNAARSRNASAEGAKEWRDNQKTVINNFNFGNLEVKSPADAARIAKDAARLRALSNRGASQLVDTPGAPDWVGQIR